MLSKRLFLAIYPPAAAMEEILALQNSLVSKVPPKSVRATPAAQIHLTLRFLGNVPVTEVPPLCDGLAAVASVSPPFKIKLSGTGGFPNARLPKVIWVGVESTGDQLESLQGEVERVCAAIAGRNDKSFHPHLTVARAHEGQSRILSAIGIALKQLPIPKPMEWPVTEFHLMESQLSSQGAIHQTLRSFVLEGTASS